MSTKTPLKLFLKHRQGLVFLCLSCVLLTTVLWLLHVSKPSKGVSSVARDDPSVCVEKKRVAYVKVHKAASSTTTSIFQRYGMSHNLTFALPKKEDPYHIGLFETLHPKNLFPMPNGTTYDILCQHVVYNEEAFAKYLPPDIAVIAAVREPLQRFVSAFQYFPEYRMSLRSLSKSLVKASDTELMREFLRNPDYYEPKAFKPGSIAVNRMSFDLGIPKEQLNNPAFVEDYIRMLDRNLKVVLVVEHFDASLVVLKRRMCWSTKDILYKRKVTGTRAKPSIPADIAQRVRKLLASDYQIYDYFSKKFEKIAVTEVDFQDEVELFQKINRNVTDLCNRGRKIKSWAITIDKNAFSEGFNVTKTDCDLLATGEEKYVHLLQNKQASALLQETTHLKTIRSFLKKTQ